MILHSYVARQVRPGGAKAADGFLAAAILQDRTSCLPLHLLCAPWPRRPVLGAAAGGRSHDS